MGNVKEGVLNRDIQTISKTPMYIQRKNATAAGQSFIAAEDVPPIRIIFIKISILCTKSDANWRKKS